MIDVSEPVLYLEALFGPMLAEQFGLQMLEPPADWLPQLPPEYRKRDVAITSLAEARHLAEPRFVKPPNDKSFPAKVYRGSELPEGYAEDSPVLVSDVVEWEVEYRSFILDRELRAISIYLRRGELQRELGFLSPPDELREAKTFIESILADPRVKLPRTAVLDVGVMTGRGWAVVEQNSAWGAGIYGCDPEAVLDVLRYASVRRDVRTG